MRYLLFVIFLMAACSWSEVRKETVSYYPVSGITAYKGQDVASLYDDNGAPNTVRYLDNGDVMWVYYTNYRPLGGGELISYEPTTGGVTCKVMVIIRNDRVLKVGTSGC